MSGDPGKFKKLMNGCSNMGTANALSFLWKAHVLNRLYFRQAKTDAYRTGSLTTTQLPHPVACRYGSSDFKVFNQIFFQDEYAPAQVSKDAKLIVDCGAYVGYSTMYFLQKYPNADLIAVEPDSRNYVLLKQNLEQYADRVTIINSAIWSHKTRLKIRRRAHGEWATTVAECGDDERADLEALDIPAILARSRHSRVDLLKLDIEGAEGVLFTRNYESWIDLVDVFVIEIHGDSYEKIFLRALSGGKFEFSTSGELTIARRHS